MLSHLSAIADVPNKRATFQLVGLMKSYARMQFFRALIDSGVAPLLDKARSVEEIATKTDISRPDLLEKLLGLGVGLGELAQANDGFVAKSAMCQALASADGAPITAMIREIANYHGDVFGEFPARLKGAPPKDYLAEMGEVVSVSSEIVAPFLRTFARQVTTGEKKHILEIGCGAGNYLVLYAKGGHGGLAIDLNTTVIEQAKTNLESHGYADNFSVIHDDIRNPSPALDGPFDLITSYQNIYYFTDDERPKLFGTILERLGEQGSFALASTFGSDRPMSNFFDIVLDSTVGCYPLPKLDVVVEELKAAGFGKVETQRLVPGDEFFGVVAQR
ncbi:MAG: class I SAM-dependent methyltransferase, partial [Proteobacteria bacterium]|nr:class I SAM-dependent methyltransferase [Pseudomonadota bacterium]